MKEMASIKKTIFLKFEGFEIYQQNVEQAHTRNLGEIDVRFEFIQDGDELKNVMNCQNISAPSILVSLNYEDEATPTLPNQKDRIPDNPEYVHNRMKIHKGIIDCRMEKHRTSCNLLSELKDADSAFGVTIEEETDDNSLANSIGLLGSPLEMRKFVFEPKVCCFQSNKISRFPSTPHHVFDLELDLEPQRKGLPTRFSRCLLSHYVKHLENTLSSERLPLYIICNGDQSLLALSVHFFPGENCGVFSEFAVPLIYDINKDLIKQFEQDHLQICDNMPILSRSYFSSFNLIQSTKMKSRVVLEIKWNQSEFILEKPICKSECTLIFQLKDDSNLSILTSYLKDIELLQKLLLFLEEDADWPIENKTKSQVIENMTNLFDECSSNEDLADCVRFLFLNMSKYNLRFKVNDDKKSELADLARDSNTNRLIVPSLLDEKLQIRLLIGAGIDKVTSDYIFMLKMKKFISSESTKSLTNRTSLSDRIAALPILHNTAEMSLLIEQYICNNLQMIVKHILEQFEKNANIEEFSIPVEYAYIYSIINKMPANIWSTTVTSDIYDNPLSSCLTMNLTVDSSLPSESISHVSESLLNTVSMMETTCDNAKEEIYEYTTNHETYFMC